MKKFESLRKKLIRFMSLTIIVHFVISNFIIYNEIIKRFETRSYTDIEQLLLQVKANLEYYVMEMDRLTVAPLYDAEILRILKNHSREDKTDEVVFFTSEESLKMSFFITSLNYARTEIGSIRLFSNDGLIFNNYEYSHNNKWTAEDSLWMQQVDEAKGGLVLIPPHIPEYLSDKPKVVVSVARNIMEPYTYKKLGVMKIDLTEEEFRKILYPAGMIYENRFYIFDNNENMIFPLASDGGFPQSEGRVVIDGEESLLLSDFSGYTGLKIYSRVPYRSIVKEAREVSAIIFYISVITLISACFFAVLFSKRLIDPLKLLKDKIRDVRKGNFDVKLDIHTNDEVGEVTEGFNSMIGEINRLVREVYQVRLRERESEIISLQSQINPHFLYNTLEIINMMALKSKEFVISDTVTKLGKLLRYTVSKQEKPVKLESEILFIENYLSIQALRLKNRFTSTIKIGAAHKGCLVPKLILQPFVENIIEHAASDGSLHIRISAMVQWGDLIIIVNDNGTGFTEEKAREIEEKMYSKGEYSEEIEQFGKTRKGFALRNVHQRLYLLYGEPYGVYIDKAVARGATFLLRLPMISEVQEGV